MRMHIKDWSPSCSLCGPPHAPHVHLRELEYFDGTLFLTTDRPGDINEAFQYCIHVLIGLNALNTEERR
jgi:hypothetical protein